MINAVLEPDRDQLEIFVDAVLRHAGDAGYVSLRNYLADNKLLKPMQTVLVRDGPREIVNVAVQQARRAAQNPVPAVFCPPIAVFNGAEGWRAREEDLFKGLVLSVECDQHPDEARCKLEEILGPATAIVRSGGQWIDDDGDIQDKLHLHWRLKTPAIKTEEKDSLALLKHARALATAIVGGDTSNVPVVHCLRWPGSWHRKGTPRLCELISVDPDREIDLDIALAELLKHAPADIRSHVGNGYATPPADADDLAADILAGQNLHQSILRLAAKYAHAGMSKEAAVNRLRALMEMSAARRERPDEWQARYDDISRLFDTGVAKYGKNEAKSAKSLSSVVKVFLKWLALKDNNPLYAMLGTVAANLLPGDPVWLGIIAPPSSAKTELLNGLATLPYIAVAEALTPAALLSGSSKKQKAKNATGGLLPELGDFGILVFKDFGTVLDMRAEARGEMLSALRRVFDGEFVRHIGVDGGRTIRWQGKAGLIFAATQKYDLYHGVIGTLGDRFILIRLDPSSAEQFDMCFKHVGQASKTMRTELATAVAALFGSLPNPLPEPAPLDETERNKLKDTVLLATRLRAGIERDRIRRDIEAVYDPEGPARLALSLERLFAGLVAIGLTRVEAMKVINKVAMDSTPRFRLTVYNSLADANWQTTRQIATAIGLPTTTTRRALEDIVAQGLAVRKDKTDDEGGADEWKRAPNPQTTDMAAQTP